jgi:hypothetical protein
MLARFKTSITRSLAIVGGATIFSTGLTVYSKNQTLAKEKGAPRILHVDFSYAPAPPRPRHVEIRDVCSGSGIQAQVLGWPGIARHRWA